MITIPATLTVANSGWNATDGISATGTLESGKKLTVTAASTNNWVLKSGDNSVGYTLTTAEGSSQTTSWEFTTLDGTAQGLGIIVDDYSNKPAGTYQDTVTFTAKVEGAITTKSLTLNGEYMDPEQGGFVSDSLTIEYTDNDTWKDIAERYDKVRLESNFYGPSEGKIVKFFGDDGDGCELKSNESTYNYNSVRRLPRATSTQPAQLCSMMKAGHLQSPRPHRMLLPHRQRPAPPRTVSR